ncbi:MAG: cold-shock protein [bacterium]|nr:cold-shock protein [bacterium]
MLNVFTVRWFDPFKGYGFIDRGNGFDVYVHFSSINRNGYRSLVEGERVSYQLARGKHGFIALNVTPLVP